MESVSEVSRRDVSWDGGVDGEAGKLVLDDVVVVRLREGLSGPVVVRESPHFRAR